MAADKGRCIQKVDTVLNADSVEWCPYVGWHHILLCGTYKLQESSPPHDEVQTDKNDKESHSTSHTCTPLAASEDGLSYTEGANPQVRVGGVTVFELIVREGCDPHVTERNKLEMCGVLDIKWPAEKLADKAMFGLVDAEGYVQIFHLQEESYTPEHVAKAKLSDSSLGLSLGWTDQHNRSNPSVAASDSAGVVTVVDVGNDVRIVTSWQAHDYEAWISAFHKSDGNMLFSGGDDCRLKIWDMRDTSRPTFISKRHQMGVCSVQSHPFRENVFASGSYDEELIVWDHRNMKQPLSCSSLGGGVWRIKWDPFTGTSILTATMYNGTHIVDCSDLGQGTLPVAARYDDHNLAYGADWCRLNTQGTARRSITECGAEVRKTNTDTDDTPFLISTCSFYDNALHLWEWMPPIKK